MLSRQIISYRHPPAFGNLLLLDGDFHTQRPQAANEVDIRLAEAIAVPVPEADQRIELSCDSGLFSDLANHCFSQVLTRMQCATRQFIARWTSIALMVLLAAHQ